MKFVIGVDEVGRGPLAGPITLSAFVAPENLRNKLIKILGGKIKDSKQFSSKRRREIYREFLKLRRENKTSFFVSHISNKIIDERGISYATNLAIKRVLVNTKRSASNRVMLDGLLKAPKEFKNQKTIIGGDGKNIFIACASIVAKVRRDRLMCRLAKKYPKYGFEIHKGYGTALHIKLIKKYGLSDLHRISFCSNIKSW
jgi:ribonuclease HII